MEVYATGFFHQETINSIWKLGGIYDLLANSNQIEIIINDKGETVKRIYLNEIRAEEDKNISNYIDLSLDDDRLLGKREGNIIEHCEYVLQPDGTHKLVKGERVYDLGNGIKRIDTVENFETITSTYTKDGIVIFTLVPKEGNSIISYDDNGYPTDFKIQGVSENYDIEFTSTGSMIVYEKDTNNIALSFDYINNEIYNTISNNGVTNFLVELANILAEETSPAYGLLSKVAQVYNFFAAEYEERHAHELQVAEYNYTQRRDEASYDWEEDLAIADNLWLSGQINDEEHSAMVEQINIQYQSLMDEIDGNYTEVRENIRRIYVFDLPQLPIPGENNE